VTCGGLRIERNVSAVDVITFMKSSRYGILLLHVLCQSNPEVAARQYQPLNHLNDTALTASRVTVPG
jgi:hypothetical protein